MEELFHCQMDVGAAGSRLLTCQLTVSPNGLIVDAVGADLDVHAGDRGGSPRRRTCSKGVHLKNFRACGAKKGLRRCQKAQTRGGNGQ